VTDDPYRATEDRLGNEERESEAVRQLGRWRDGTRTRILLAFAALGLVLSIPGYSIVQDLQFRYNGGVALLMVNIGVGVVVPFLAMMLIGRFVGNRVVATRIAAKVVELAKAYEISPDKLNETATLVREL
jgi:hypothetical protein